MIKLKNADGRGAFTKRYRSFLLQFLINTTFLFLPSLLSAQFYQSGQDPFSIKWQQINSPNFQVIFPAEFEPEANRLASILEYIYNHVSKSLNRKPKKISVILHSQSSYSNGFVTWAPKRMELYTTPPQDIYSHDWIEQLAVHELRHVVQMDKLNQGITKIFRILLGEQAVGGVSGFVPRWFLEGDAVATETALTSTGRGRMASFEMEMKALATSQKKLFSYEKAILGSYKHYLPDHYHLGYPIVAWSRQKYGSEIFDHSLNFVSHYPYVLFPFPLSLKKQTGINIKNVYKEAYTDLKTSWSSQMEKAVPTLVTNWNKPKKKHFTSYRFPQPLNDSMLFVIKSGINQLKEFTVIHKNGHEKRIHIPGNFYNDKISVASGKFVWAEEIPDIRWQNRSFYCIKVGDIATGKVRMLTSGTRYFAPSLSPDGTKIAVIEVSTKNLYSLVILDTETGKILEKHASPENEFLQLPEWTAHGKSIIVISLSKKGKSIHEFSTDTQSWKEVYPPTFKDISLPADAGDYALFSADFTGTNNIYAVSKKDGSLWQVTDSKLGAFEPKTQPNGYDIFYSEYSSQGYNIVSVKFDPQTWKKADNLADGSPKLYETLAKQENFNLQDSVIPIQKYPSKKYSRLAHTFNIHSWAPFYYDYDNLSLDYTAVKPGFSLTSQDKLGTCLASGGYAYDEGQHLFKAKITYQALFPVFEFSTTFGGPVWLYSGPTSVQKPAITKDKLDLTGRMYVPLNFSRGAYTTGITPSIELSYKNNWFYYPDEKAYLRGMSYVSYYLYAYRYLRTSHRDLAPRWGITLSAKYNSTPFEDAQFGRIYYVRSRVYLPGILPHHSLQISGAFQKNESKRYIFSSLLPFPRGMSSLSSYIYQNPLIVSNKLQAFTADYSFPILYPDINLGPIFYLKRIRGNLFFDASKNQFDGYMNGSVKIIGKTETLTSTGGDLTGDFHLFRILFPINAGIRMIYFPNTGEYFPQLLFRIDLANY